MANCKNCGYELEENSRFCSECGTIVEEPVAEESFVNFEDMLSDAPAPEVKNEEAKKECDCKPPRSSRYAPLTAWSTFGSLLLFSIPLAGPIILFVWMCCSVKNQNKRALARGLFIYHVFFYVLAFAVALTLILLGVLNIDIFAGLQSLA